VILDRLDKMRPNNTLENPALQRATMADQVKRVILKTGQIRVYQRVDQPLAGGPVIPVEMGS